MFLCLSGWGAVLDALSVHSTSSSEEVCLTFNILELSDSIVSSILDSLFVRTPKEIPVRQSHCHVMHQSSRRQQKLHHSKEVDLILSLEQNCMFQPCLPSTFHSRCGKLADWIFSVVRGTLHMPISYVLYLRGKKTEEKWQIITLTILSY